MKVSHPPLKAAGIKAVTNSLKLITKVMGIGKTIKLLSKLNQKDGIDCPGCAWPDPEKRSRLGEFCENGVKAIAEEATIERIDKAFFAKYSIDFLRKQSDYWLGQRGRLTSPMMIREGDTHYSPIEWEDVFQILTSELKSYKDPNEAIFYTSGRTSNEAAFLYQLLVRMYGTNNLPDCSNMCHESSGVGLTETVGIGKGSVALEDFDKAEVILIFGQNPGTNHPRMLTALENAKKHGAKVVCINPLKEVGLVRFKNPQTALGILGNGSEIADLYLQLKINEDVALLKAIMKMILEEAKSTPLCIDQAFIDAKTAFYEEFVEELANHSLDDLIDRTGLGKDQVQELFDLLVSNKKIIACWAMGLTQHKNGVDNVREIVNLLLLKGSIGKEGAGTCPVRGHSNVQGDRTMGIHEKPSPKLIDKIAENFGFTPPANHGYSVIEAIESMHNGSGKFFFAMGGNFLSAAPDTYYTAEALQRCNLTAHVSTKLNRSHLYFGKVGLILPCLGRTDKQPVQTVENSMGVVHTTRGFLSSPSKELLSEVEIISRLGESLFGTKTVAWDSFKKDYSGIRKLIEQTIEGFTDFESKVKSGFELYNGARVGVFHTKTQKAQFSMNQLSDIQTKDGEYVMMTIRSHDQFNTTIYGLDDRYRGIKNGRMPVFMNPADIKKEGLQERDLVTLYNEYGEKRREVKGFDIVSYDIPEGNVATYFPEANPLVPLSEYAHTSLTPASKSIKVKIKK